MTDVIDEARTWLADDPDPQTRAELSELIARAEDADATALADLGDRFAGFLQFGTAGLRGELGAGPNRMNRVVVIRAAAGLAGFLHAMRPPVDARRHRVVVGYDARHGSHTFAVDTAAVMTAAGIDAVLMPRTLPTPVLAFAVRQLDADAGVMVTASHNPPRDNGYKVYLGGEDAGAQIVPPADAEIASFIHDVGASSRVPRAEGGWAMVDEAVVNAYLDAAAAMAAPGGPRELRVVLTSMHGVGGTSVVEALTRAGFTDLHVVAQQAEPDPDFPTVEFPNPEEPGAVDLALALAGEVGADIVVANDPDADRCAVAVPDTTAVPAADGGWRLLTGDEVGALLGEHLAARGARGTFANSVVSSRLLGKVATAHGLDHIETLTGFKWISRAPGLTFGYEEALGYCVDPGSVRDKDGISAAVLVAELAAAAKAEGASLLDRLDALAGQHGVHATAQVSLRVHDLAVIDETMRRIRRHPPTALAGVPVERVDDLLHPTTALPPTDALRLLTTDDSRVVVRPSGTEPKLKCYLEVVVPVGGDGLGAARHVAADRLDALRAAVTALVEG